MLPINASCNWVDLFRLVQYCPVGLHVLQTGRNTVLNVYYRLFHAVMHNVVLMRGDCSNELEKKLPLTEDQRQTAYHPCQP